MSATELISQANKTLSNIFVLYFKVHGFHWNVTGMQFDQMHSFFGSLYEDLHDSVDALAEEIRALDSFAPKTLSELYNNATLIESELLGEPLRMLNQLKEDVDSLITDHTILFDMATNSNKQGLADYVAGRIDDLNKWNWKIKSFIS